MSDIRVVCPPKSFYVFRMLKEYMLYSAGSSIKFVTRPGVAFRLKKKLSFFKTLVFVSQSFSVSKYMHLFGEKTFIIAV